MVKKPERFGGEIDIVFDDTIPIELKVRHGRKEPLDVADVDATFKPGGQAAAYAAISRLGFVVVLDLPGSDVQVVSLENCATVIERRGSGLVSDYELQVPPQRRDRQIQRRTW